MEIESLKDHNYNCNAITMQDPNIVEEEPEIKELGCRTIVLTDSQREPFRARNVKYYWATGNMFGKQAPLTCVYGSPEGYLGFPGDTIASTSLWPELWHFSEPDPTVWRGVFCLTYTKKVLFSKEVTIRTDDLPRWKPKVIIDRRTLERDDE
jgi:hypothetical protein